MVGNQDKEVYLHSIPHKKPARNLVMAKKIKILHVLDAVGGVEVYLNLLIKHIDPNKFEFVIVHGRKDLNFSTNQQNDLIITDYKIPIQREIRPLKDFRCLLELRKIIKREKPDLIHAHSAKSGALARTLAFFGTPLVLYTPHAFSYLSAENKSKRWLYLSLERILSHSGSYVVATSDSESKRAIEDVKYKPNKVLVYPNSIEPITQVSILPNEPYRFSGNYICSVGRPSYQKNIESMVKIFEVVKKENPDLKFVLIGVGFYSPNKEKIEQMITRYHLEESFIMIPWLEREDIFPIVKNAKLYISTSRYEGLPYSIIESMALEKAFVVSDCDGNKDLIHSHKNGFVIEQEKLEEQMPKFITELLNNEEKRKKFEACSLSLFSQNYNINNTISKLENIYLKFST